MLRLVLCFSVCVFIITLSGCQGAILMPYPSHPVVHEAGPPDHAPAHGHRSKHQKGPELTYDSGLGVYLVTGHTDIYYHDGWFIRVHDGNWQVSASLDGSWKAQPTESVPSALRSKHHGKKHKNPKARGRGAAKLAW